MEQFVITACADAEKKEYPCNACGRKGCNFDRCEKYLEWFKCEWNSIVVPLRKKYKVKVKRR